MPITFLVFFGVPILLLLMATGTFAQVGRARGGDPVAAVARLPRR